jgi:predicted HTH transcriptional regulator
MLTETELIAKLRNCEDNWVERKTANDTKDVEKTVVAFANSTPIGYPAVLFIGVRDDGSIEDGQPDRNLDSLQKTVNNRIQKNVYPAVYYLITVLIVDGKQCLAVTVPGSDKRPHFSGPSYIRVGSETILASDAQFNQLIAQRLSKPNEILRWKDKVVTVDLLSTQQAINAMGRIASTTTFMVADCNAFYVTLKGHSSSLTTYPLDRIGISYDTEHERLRLEVAP